MSGWRTRLRGYVKLLRSSMLPLRPIHKPQRAPLVTRLLVTINVLVFLWQLVPGAIGHEARQFFVAGAVVPHCYFSPGACGIGIESRALWQPFLASMFLHAGWLHLAFNMLFLSVFGAGVEEKMGKVRFLAFYLACGIVATTLHVVTHPFSDAALVGASGAIAGVLGAYFVLLPKSWVLTYFPPIWLFPVPASIFLLLWILAQIAAVFSPLWNRVLDSGNVGNNGHEVAWMAHIGGFACGAFWAWRINPWWKSKPKRDEKK